MTHTRLYNIMAGQSQGLPAAATRLGLSALTPAYRLAVTLRNKQFDLGLRKPATLPRPTISVGNLTTGGTGKTPMVIELARRLLDQGQKPAVLLRGYMKGNAGDTSTDTSGGSDEAVELARELGSSVPVEPNPDRAEAARRVLEKHPGVTVFLLDDGFQHRQVHRDLDIVLIDATRPFGFDHLLPRGLLREPPRNLRRADAVIVTRCDLVTPQALADLDRQIESLTGKLPTAHAANTWSGFRDQTGEMSGGADHLKDKKVTAACAIGNPAAFQRMLQAAAGEVLHVHAFDDHHAYTADEIQHLLTDAKQRGADAIIVTEKDWVKWIDLKAGANAKKGVPPVVRPRLGVCFLDGFEAMNTMLKTREIIG